MTATASSDQLTPTAFVARPGTAARKHVGSHVFLLLMVVFLQGQFFINQNLRAAGALITAVPTLVVYVLLQKQFSAGLWLGSSND